VGVAKSRGAEVDSGRARRGKGRGRRDDRVKGGDGSESGDSVGADHVGRVCVTVKDCTVRCTIDDYTRGMRRATANG
jgi:hypothetical protein